MISLLRLNYKKTDYFGHLYSDTHLHHHKKVFKSINFGHDLRSSLHLRQTSSTFYYYIFYKKNTSEQKFSPRWSDLKTKTPCFICRTDLEMKIDWSGETYWTGRRLGNCRPSFGSTACRSCWRPCAWKSGCWCDSGTDGTGARSSDRSGNWSSMPPG